MLRKETQFDVRIFDLNWLVEKTLESEAGRRAVVEDLGMSPDLVKSKYNGTNDLSRSMRLKEINEQLADEAGSLSNHEKIELADEAAEIAGRLEQSDEAIEGYLKRHYGYAKKYGDTVEFARAVYLYAYRIAAYYSEFEMDLFYQRYIELESLALDNRSKFIIELLITLWTILNVQSIQNSSDAKFSEIDCNKHAEVLKQIERELTEVGDRESVATEISMRLIPVRLILGEDSQELLEKVIELVDRSKKYSNIDCGIIVEMFKTPDMFDECDLLDEAMELMFERVRDDEGASALAPSLFSRGVSLEKAGRAEKAIGMYTRTAICIRGGDDKSNLVKTLLRLSSCYEKIGLYWFARNACCLALNIGIDTYYGSGYLFNSMVYACNRLKYFELGFGRLPVAIKLDNLELYLASLFSKVEYPVEDAELFSQSLAMGSLLIDPGELRASDKLSSCLDRVGYPYAAQMIDYAMGYYDAGALDELQCSESEYDALVAECFSHANELCYFAGRSSFSDEGPVVLSTKLMGCDINVTT